MKNLHWVEVFGFVIIVAANMGLGVILHMLYEHGQTSLTVKTVTNQVTLQPLIISITDKDNARFVHTYSVTITNQ